jgi:hypothetical protein
VPLDNDEFEMIAGSLKESVLLLFKRNRSLAYSPDEVIFELATFGVATTREVIGLQLRDLVRMGRLVTAERDGEIYYRYDDRLGLGPR